MKLAVKGALALFLAAVLTGPSVHAEPNRAKGTSSNYTRPEFPESKPTQTPESDPFDAEPDFSFDPAKSKPIMLDRMVRGLRRGDQIGWESWGIFCNRGEAIYWKGSRGDLEAQDFSEVFFEEVQALGLRTAGDPDAMFEDTSAGSAEIIVRGAIKDLFVERCFIPDLFGATGDIRTEARVTIAWQVYSVLDRRVVYETTTSGYLDRKMYANKSDYFGSILDAFANASHKLLSDKGFHRVIANSGEMITAQLQDSLRGNMLLDRGSAKVAKDLNDWSKAVGTVIVGSAHGSGFFITSKGHMLTNQHVVTNARYVKVLMKSGEEFLGEVLRKSKSRDVALIKVSTTPEWVVQLKRVEPDVGEEVFAVGSPMEIALSATITKGIVSAKRVRGGQRYIQADAAISPGNSGGPLFDSKGNVVGMSTSKRNEADNIGFFGPVNELLNALSIDVQ